jgi:hypothetical protein
MRIQLNEGLNYMDMEHQIVPVLGVDQYQSSVGTDDDLITLDFTVKGKAPAQDLAEWFEKGYDWVIDGDISPGEVRPGQFITFVEMNRRLKSPERIVEMIEDLETLTGFTLDKWKLKIANQELELTVDNIRKHLVVSPHEYREVHPDETGDDALNEWKQIAGVSMITATNKDSDAIRAIKRQAGLI